MTIKEHLARLTEGTRVRCTDHWIEARIGVEAVVERAGATVSDWRVDGKPYRSETPKARNLVRCDERGWRVELVENGRAMFWEWEVIA